MELRPAASTDADAIWAILEPIVRAGETFALPRDMSREAALAWWHAPGNEVFVAEDAGSVLGTYFIHPNQQGPGSHVSQPRLRHRALGNGLRHRPGDVRSLAAARAGRARGYRAMQFNIVISTNAPAVHLWTSMVFRTLCRVPRLLHPTRGYVDTLAMFREL